MSRSIRFLLTLLLALTLAMPIVGPSAAQEDPIQIAASTPILADIVQNVTGDRAEVFSIMPVNADPHTWEASPQDIMRVTEADSFISIGAHLEPFVESGGWRRAVMDAGVPQLVLTDHVDLIEVDMVIDHGDHVHDLRGGDPHIWLDPTKVIESIPAIVAHLSEIDPDGAATYEANAATFTSELEALDTELAESFAAIPDDRRVLVVFHDAFRYFAARYGFEIVGVVIQNPEVEISAQEVVELQKVIAEYDIPAIFAEPQFNPDILETIIAGEDVAIGTLLTDTFTEEITTYVDLMRFNRDSIVEFLG
jgi:manganese/iron transport system substrate-binding protein